MVDRIRRLALASTCGLVTLACCPFVRPASPVIDYRACLENGCSAADIKALYDSYAANILDRAGDRTLEIDALAGGHQYRDSFLLACLSHGWTLRAEDISPDLSPPAGAWLYTARDYSGAVRQVSGRSSTLGAFNDRVKSITLGESVDAELFSATDYDRSWVVLKDSSNALSSTIKSIKLRTRPRLDYVTVSDFAISAGKVSLTLHVSGANFDERATIRIDGADRPTTHRVILDNRAHLYPKGDVENPAHPLDPAYLGYPIYHYGSATTALSTLTAGGSVMVEIRNPDGQVSDTKSYELAASEATLDSDGDGLLDHWETGGFDADGDGTIDVDLKALGARPLRKDLFVEVDRMIVPKRVWSAYADAHYPDPEIWPIAVATFRDAPILNPDGSAGIALHVDYGQDDFGATKGQGGTEIPWTMYIDIGENRNKQQYAQYTDLCAIRKNPAYFDPDRERIFRYCVFGDQRASGTSGVSAGVPSKAFLVTLGNFEMHAVDRNYQLGTFVHEFGHTLGLTHAGSQSETYNRKPNFNSVMNYRFQMQGIDIDGSLSSDDHVYSYSDGMRAMLDEAALLEALGVANHIQQDWNGNGKIDSDAIPWNVRRDHARTDTNSRVDADYPGWAHLDLAAVTKDAVDKGCLPAGSK